MNVSGKKSTVCGTAAINKRTVSHSASGKNTPYQRNEGNMILRSWLNDRIGRGKALSKILYNDTRTGVSHYKSGRHPIYKEDIPKLKAAMYIVESMEPQTKAKYGAMPNAA